jgi:release factor glutamine methyltransferase
MKISDLLRDASLAATERNVPDSALRLMLSGIMDCSVPDIALRAGMDVSPELYSRWQQALPRLLDNEPAQYILGKAWFYGLELKVDPSVLIPRPETEGLVELVMPMLRDGIRILDVGTGSGAIAIAIKNQFPQAEVHASDIDPRALETARANALQHGADIIFHNCDLIPEHQAPWDIIISNPPYVSSSEYASLDDEVRLHEPSLALLAGEDGLDTYRQLIPEARDKLKPGGVLALEHGQSQRESINRLASGVAYSLILAGNDLAGRHRYLIFASPLIQHKKN